MHPPTTEPSAGGRVLVALDASPRSLTALATAGALAAELGAELAGLFVEDINLQRLLALPFAHELCMLSGIVRPLSQAEVEHAWRREAALLQRQLAEAARQQQLRWSFQVTRGRLALEVNARIAAFDLVVLGPHAGMGVHGTQRTPAPSRKAPILVLCESGSTSHRALDLAIRLARHNDTGIVLLIPAADEAAYRSSCATVQALLRARGASGRCLALPDRGRTSLARAVRREAAACLVLGDHHHILEQEELARGRDGIECPIVISH